MRSLFVLTLAVLVLGAVLVAARARLPAEAPFTVGLPERSPSRLELEGVRTRIACGAGHLDLGAGRARAGHEDVLYFRLGPSTYIALEEVEATYLEEAEHVWHARSATARIDGHVLVLSDAVVDRGAKGKTTVAEWSVDLDTGKVNSR